MRTGASLVDERPRETFDVICAGEPLWKLAHGPDGLVRSGMQLRSGIVQIARMLSRSGIRVGLATVLDDDTFGRTSLERIASLGVHVGGVKLASPATALVVVDAAGGQSGVLSERDPERGFDVPAGWSSQVLLLSGLSPVTSTAAALCRAARKARRDGTTVVLDVMASMRTWAGRDPRTISMVLRETDVVRCGFADLAILGMDAASVRQAMRPNATLVIHDTSGAVATGPFGEVRCAFGERGRSRNDDAGDSCTAAICAELARPRALGESAAGRWHRVLQGWSTQTRVDRA